MNTYMNIKGGILQQKEKSLYTVIGAFAYRNSKGENLNFLCALRYGSSKSICICNLRELVD